LIDLLLGHYSTDILLGSHRSKGRERTGVGRRANAGEAKRKDVGDDFGGHGSAPRYQLSRKIIVDSSRIHHGFIAVWFAPTATVKGNKEEMSHARPPDEERSVSASTTVTCVEDERNLNAADSG
jgi:hypothetical protein